MSVEQEEIEVCGLMAGRRCDGMVYLLPTLLNEIETLFQCI